MKNTNRSMMEMAVNHALSEMRRLAPRAYGRADLMALDAKRPRAWCEYGYPETVGPRELRNLYSRGGVAHGAVRKVVRKCWSDAPEVYEGDERDETTDPTPWDTRLKQVLNRRFWRAFAETDKRRLVQRFAGLLLRVADNKDWDQPVVTVGAEIRAFLPVWQTELQVMEYETNLSSEFYGQPLFWQYQEPRSGDAAGGRVLKVHRDRIFILGDWTSNALGFLEPAFNDFINLEKISGGAGESFLKNAARQTAINFDKDINFEALAQMYGVNAMELHAQIQKAAQDLNHGVDTVLVTQGAQVSSLVATVPNPEPPFRVAIQSISAALDIPQHILIGMQTGERASTEDADAFNASMQSRRSDELTDDILAFIEHLTRIRVIEPRASVHVEWSDLNESRPSEKMNLAKTMTEINDSAAAGGVLIFSNDEIRVAAGYEPGGDVDPLGEEDDDLGDDPTEE